MKKLITSILESIERNPLAFLLVVLVLTGLAIWFISSQDVDDPKHDAQQTEQKIDLEGKKTEAEELITEGEKLHEEAARSDARLERTKRSIKEKTDNVKKLSDEAAAAGRADIPLSDVPSNFQLCTRANSLGVRCDFDQ